MSIFRKVFNPLRLSKLEASLARTEIKAYLKPTIPDSPRLLQQKYFGISTSIFTQALDSIYGVIALLHFTKHLILMTLNVFF